MEATDQIDKLIDSRSKGRETANAEARAAAHADRIRQATTRAENRALWIEHCRRQAASHLASLAKEKGASPFARRLTHDADVTANDNERSS